MFYTKFFALWVKIENMSFYTRIYRKSTENWSSPKYPLCSHYLVCIENHLFIAGIGPIRDKEL